MGIGFFAQSTCEILQSTRIYLFNLTQLFSLLSFSSPSPSSLSLILASSLSLSLLSAKKRKSEVPFEFVVL